MEKKSKELATSERQSRHFDQKLNGEIRSLTSIRMDFEDGTTVIAPEEFSFNKSSLKYIDDIIAIGCGLTGWCGGGGTNDGGGSSSGNGCTKIINPDGSTIELCPPPKRNMV